MLIYPTETFYGLGGDPYQTEVVERIYRLKERDGRKPLPLIAADEAAARRAARVWPEVAERLARAFWPGTPNPGGGGGVPIFANPARSNR